MGFEGGNFYEDQIVRDQNQVERQEERDAIDERLDRAEVTQETTGGVESVQADMERQEKVDTMLARFELLAEKEGYDGVDVFKEFILNAELDIQEQFLDRGNITQLFNTIKESGRFPVNEFEFQQSLVEGTILEDYADQTEDYADQTEDYADQTEDYADQIEDYAEGLDYATHIQNKILSFDAVTKSTRVNNIALDLIFEKIGKIDLNDDINTTEELKNITGIYTELQQILLQGNYLEKSILEPARQSGNYEAVRNSLIDLGGGSDGVGGMFYERIRAFEIAPPVGNLEPEQIVRVSAAMGVRVDEVGENSEQSGNIFTIEGIGGTEVNYDVVTNERSISLDGYTIESQIDDVGDYQTPKLTYMRVEQAHLPQVQKLIIAGQALESAQLQDDNIVEIKNILRDTLGYAYFSELSIDSLDSAADIQRIIKNTFSEHNSELQDARDEYRDELIRLRDVHIGILTKKDERVRNTLSMLQGVGITQMPQSVFTQISEAINIDPAAYGFQTQINLEEGILGFNASGDNENKDRVMFAKMVNIMLGVEPEDDIAVNIQAVNGIGQTAISNRSDFDTYVAEQSGWHSVGATNTILQRLRDNRRRE